MFNAAAIVLFVLYLLVRDAYFGFEGYHFIIRSLETVVVMAVTGGAGLRYALRIANTELSTEVTPPKLYAVALLAGYAIGIILNVVIFVFHSFCLHILYPEAVAMESAVFIDYVRLMKLLLFDAVTDWQLLATISILYVLPVVAVGLIIHCFQRRRFSTDYRTF